MESATRKMEPGSRLAERVYGQVLEFIFEQDLEQGDRLPSEHELSRMTAVSRPIVREALMRLQADGLIESRRGAGSFVRQRPGERQIQHLRPPQVRARLDAFEVRIAVEPVAARLAAQHRGEQDLQVMRDALKGLAAAHAAGEPGGDHDLRLHQAVAAASQNPMFLLVFHTLEAQVEELIVPSLALVAEQRNERAARMKFEHTAIVEAIAAGDADAAEAAMQLHLVLARSRALRMRW